LLQQQNENVRRSYLDDHFNYDNKTWQSCSYSLYNHVAEVTGARDMYKVSNSTSTFIASNDYKRVRVLPFRASIFKLGVKSRLIYLFSLIIIRVPSKKQVNKGCIYGCRNTNLQSGIIYKNTGVPLKLPFRFR
jgi:hypothetical protein